MTAQKPRNRIVVFRLSQDEFLTLKTACAEKGGRNLSEFTRSELLNFLSMPAYAAPLDQRLGELERQMMELLTGMRHMTTLLNAEDPTPRSAQ